MFEAGRVDWSDDPSHQFCDLRCWQGQDRARSGPPLFGWNLAVKEIKVNSLPFPDRRHDKVDDKP